MVNGLKQVEVYVFEPYIIYASVWSWSRDNWSSSVVFCLTITHNNNTVDFYSAVSQPTMMSTLRFQMKWKPCLFGLVWVFIPRFFWCACFTFNTTIVCVSSLYLLCIRPMFKHHTGPFCLFVISHISSKVLRKISCLYYRLLSFIFISLIYSINQSLIRVFLLPFIHAFIHHPIHSLSQSVSQLIIHLFSHPPIHLLIHFLIHPAIFCKCVWRHLHLLGDQCIIIDYDIRIFFN